MPSYHQTPVFTLRAQARATHQRRLLLLEGTADWTLASAQALVEALLAEEPLSSPSSPPDPCWIGRGPAQQALPVRQAMGLLGGERELIVYDVFSGLDPDALAAAAGTLRGGGLLVLLCPPLPQWADLHDPSAARIATYPYRPEALASTWIARAAAILADTQPLMRLRQNAASVDLPELTPSPSHSFCSATQPRTPTPDQHRVIKAILALAHQANPRPLVVSAARGRGKSTALGLATAQLRRQGRVRVLVTAPKFRAARTLIEQAGSGVAFLPPDQLARTPASGELLLIDEAAALPMPLLEALLQRDARLVMATTVDGYEGSGRGFLLRLLPLLDQAAPGWRHLNLHQPLRWASDDPLEALLNRLLLLDAEPASRAQVIASAAQSVRIHCPVRQQLAEQEDALRAVFGLLRLAHYQTRPSDLRQLLDGPELHLINLERGAVLLGTLLMAREGGMDPQLSAAIFAGARRPRGHLLPQTLSAHAGLAEAPRLRFARILRVAVHPAARRQGHGRALLVAAVEQAQAQGLDVIGASFGVTAPLLDFWRACGFCPVHLGTRRNAASGARAMVVLRALSDAGERFFQQAVAQFNALARESTAPVPAPGLSADAPHNRRGADEH